LRVGALAWGQCKRSTKHTARDLARLAVI